MTSRDLEAARVAYSNADGETDPKAIELSKRAHDAPRATEEHKSGGEFVKSLVFGGMDGIITTFAVVAAVKGGDLPVKTVLIMGFANLFADGLSMGFGDFLSSEAEGIFAESERKRERWELENYEEGEKKEMVELYTDGEYGGGREKGKGLKPEEAQQVIDIMARNKEFFVDIMMVEELGIMPPEDTMAAAKGGFVTFCSFLFFGCIPLIVYVITAISLGTEKSAEKGDLMFGLAVLFTCLALLALGAVKGVVTSDKAWELCGIPTYTRPALWTLLNGGTAAAISYLVGWGIEEAIKKASGDDAPAAVAATAAALFACCNTTCLAGF